MDNSLNIELENFYESIGLQPKQFKSKDSLNIFKMMGFEPKFNANGERVLTPYEILGVLPQFENGKEKPIVFAIKNRTARIGKYEGLQTNFIYKPGKVKDQKSILSTLKTNYKRAVFEGNQDQASSILESIEALTGRDASEFIGSFYDYSKYYRKMKKQLLIDMFAHFFLMYIRSTIKSIKKGVIYKNKVYKPFKETSTAYLETVNEMGDTEVVPVVDPAAFGLGNMQKIVVNDNEGNMVNNIEFAEDGTITEKRHFIQNLQKGNTEKTVLEQNQNLQTTSSMPDEELKTEKVESQKNEKATQSKYAGEDGLFGLFSKSFIKRKKKYKNKINEQYSVINEKGKTQKIEENTNEFGFEV